MEKRSGIFGAQAQCTARMGAEVYCVPGKVLLSGASERRGRFCESAH